MDVASSLNQVFHSELHPCSLMFIFEWARKEPFVVVVPLECSWYAADEPTFRDEESALVRSAWIAALELRWFRFIPDVASHVARLNLVFTAFDVQDKNIGGWFLILMEADNVSDSELGPSLQHEFVFAPRDLRYFNRAIVN